MFSALITIETTKYIMELTTQNHAITEIKNREDHNIIKACREKKSKNYHSTIPNKIVNLLYP